MKPNYSKVIHMSVKLEKEQKKQLEKILKLASLEIIKDIRWKAIENDNSLFDKKRVKLVFIKYVFNHYFSNPDFMKIYNYTFLNDKSKRRY